MKLTGKLVNVEVGNSDRYAEALCKGKEATIELPKVDTEIMKDGDVILIKARYSKEHRSYYFDNGIFVDNIVAVLPKEPEKKGIDWDFIKRNIFIEDLDGDIARDRFVEIVKEMREGR